MAARVEFHTGVSDPVMFACRLLRKAYRNGARVLLTAPPPTLAALDEALWTFEPQAFIPHVRLPGPAVAVAARTPIWLASELPAPPRPPLLVNLGAGAPQDADEFERVIEVVATDDGSVQAGRDRWRHYEGWGVKPKHHAGAG